MNVMANSCSLFLLLPRLLLLLLLIVFVHVVDTVVDLVVDKVGFAAITGAGSEMTASGPGLKYVQK